MKLWLQQHKKAVLRSLLVLLAAWCVWYARPLDIHDLMDGQTPEILAITTISQRYFPEIDQASVSLTPEDPEMDAAMEQLKALRFHRSPLDLALCFLPQRGRSVEVVPEADYSIYIDAYNRQNEWILSLTFDVKDWTLHDRQKGGFHQFLPLYVNNGQVEGRKLGRFFEEIAQEIDSKM